MWGIWAILLGGLTAGFMLLAMGLFLFASPVIAVLIFIAAMAALAVVFVGRRGAAHAEDGAGTPSTESRTSRSARPQNPRSGGAPASGEGDPPPVESGMPRL